MSKKVNWIKRYRNSNKHHRSLYKKCKDKGHLVTWHNAYYGRCRRCRRAVYSNDSLERDTHHVSLLKRFKKWFKRTFLR